MVFAEILMMIGSNGTYQDGMPIVVKGSGLYMSPAQIINWFQNSVTPPGYTELPENEQDLHYRRLQQIKYLTAGSTTPIGAATIRFGTSYTNGSAAMKAKLEAIVQRHMDGAQIDRANIVAHGYDTNWGAGDLKSFGVITVSLPPGFAEDVALEQIDDTAHPYVPLTMKRRRRWKIPYAALLPGPEVASMQNPGSYTPVNRTRAPFTPAQIKQAALA